MRNQNLQICRNKELVEKIHGCRRQLGAEKTLLHFYWVQKTTGRKRGTFPQREAKGECSQAMLLAVGCPHEDQGLL